MIVVQAFQIREFGEHVESIQVDEHIIVDVTGRVNIDEVDLQSWKN